MAVYKTMQGKEVDMNKLVHQNEMTIAVGNLKVNARGDELGPGGKIIRKAEETGPQATPSQTVMRKQIDNEDPTGGV
jgi:hypothetical protein